MRFPQPPELPEIPKHPPTSAATTTSVDASPLGVSTEAEVGIGIPKHFDPNNPSVQVDATVHNPTGIGGDLHVSREVKLPTEAPALDLSLPSSGSREGAASSPSGVGFGLPSLGNPLSGLSMPSLPDLPSLGNPLSGLSLPDMPSLGNPLSGVSAPDPSLPDMPSFGNPLGGLSLPDLPSIPNPFAGTSLGDFTLVDLPSIGTPGMPGFRFLDLPEFSMPEFDLGDWSLPSLDLFSDDDPDTEDEPERPHRHLKHQDKLKVDVSLMTVFGKGIPGVPFRIRGEGNFEYEGRLDRSGEAKVEIPAGPYHVEYLDPVGTDDKILALEIERALDESDFVQLPELLFEATERLSAVTSAFRTCTGKPLDETLESFYKRKGRDQEFDALWCHLGDGRGRLRSEQRHEVSA